MSHVYSRLIIRLSSNPHLCSLAELGSRFITGSRTETRLSTKLIVCVIIATMIVITIYDDSTQQIILRLWPLAPKDNQPARHSESPDGAKHVTH